MGDVLESFNQHALLAQRIVVQRSVDFRHSLLPGPVFRRAEQQARDLEVVDSVEPAEAGAFLSIQLVVARIDHAADPADDFLSVEDHPKFPGAVLQGRDFGQGMDLVAVKRRYILLAVPVQLVRETDESFEVSPGSDFDNLVIGHNWAVFV